MSQILEQILGEMQKHFPLPTNAKAKYTLSIKTVGNAYHPHFINELKFDDLQEMADFFNDTYKKDHTMIWATIMVNKKQLGFKWGVGLMDGDEPFSTNPAYHAIFGEGAI